MIKDKHRPYFRWGITIFLIFVCCILFFFALFRLDEVQALTHKITGILSPIIWGLVIAYLLWPIVRKVRDYLLPRLPASIKKEKSRKKISLGIGIACALLFMALLVAVLLSFLLPELTATIMTLVNNIGTYVSTVETWIHDILESNPQLQSNFHDAFLNLSAWLQTWLQETLLSQIDVVLTGVTTSIIGVGKAIMNFVIGIIVSIYVFASKDTFAGQFKKILYAFFKPEHANVILDVCRESHRIFGGFISGKLLDSLIIGILCFICLSFLDMPYTLLVSVVVGVTNIIPFFGPFIGAIPSAFLILLISPSKCLIFLIFILVLQQFDGNILGPAILGDSTGLSSFWVIFSILLGGGLFGFAGMILGVPTCGVLYYITKRIVDGKLAQKHFPTETGYYSPEGIVVDPVTRTLIPATELPENKKKAIDEQKVTEDITTDKNEAE